MEWFVAQGRTLPWRTSRGVRRDPWQTLVSEVMSQQTRLDVVVPRFLEWMRQFPTPENLANASEQEVLAAWAGLGYYSRARNLFKAAQEVSQKGWPLDCAGFLDLAGVGPYTASALASLCCGERVAMVDGNVLRVLARFHALGQDLRSGTGKRLLERLAADWVSKGDAGEVNEATMELGALVCLPRQPRCEVCPLSSACRACALGEVEQFPAKKTKTETVVVNREVVVVVQGDRVFLRPSRADELLTGLSVPPDLCEAPQIANPRDCGTVRHAITHHKVLWTIYHETVPQSFCPPPTWFGVTKNDLPKEVVSSLVRKALEKAGVWPS